MKPQDIHDLIRVLRENKQEYDAKAIYHANSAIIYSQASKSMKRCMKLLKKECRKQRRKIEKDCA